MWIYFLLISIVLSSPNGTYYACDTVAPDDGVCKFIVTDEGTANLAFPGQGNADNTGGDYTALTYGVANGSNTQLSPSPAPWTDGTQIRPIDISGGAYSEGDYAYALAFRLTYELRNELMYEPATLKLDEDRFDKLTQSFRDCSIKTEVDGGIASTDSLKEIFFSANGVTSQHTVLQYLEEGVIDLVCTMLDHTQVGPLETFERCIKIEDLTVKPIGDEDKLCDCWQSAFVALTGDSIASLNLDADRYTTCTFTADTGTDTTTTTVATATAAADSSSASTMVFLWVMIAIVLN